MFNEQSAGNVINQSASATAAAFTLAMLNSTAGVGVTGTNPSTGSLSTSFPPLSIQLNQSQQQHQLTQLLTGKDSRWLQLEICREYQRGQCIRSEQECKYAHPPSNVEIQNGRVTACFDSIKGRCSRENPKCKYLHPPQHLKDQLLANGKQNLVMKNLISQQYSNQLPAVPSLVTQQQFTNPLAIQSALSLPYFIPSLYPGQASLLSSAPDPFSAAFQNTQAVSIGAHLPPTASAFPLHHATTLGAQLALLQQQPTPAAMLLAQQQYIAFLQQQQMNAALAAVAAQSNRSSSSGNDNIEQQMIEGSRKRGARFAGLDQQQNSKNATLQMAQLNSSDSTANNTNPYIAVTASGVTTKRQKMEIGASSSNSSIGLKCIPTTTVAIGMPIYATPQFNPYLIPTAQFLPAVPFSGHVPPRFH